MNKLTSFLSVLTIALTLPGVAMAGGTCDQLCSATKDSVKNLIADPKCKSSASCTDCVANSVLGSQSGAQCQGYNSTKKSSGTQVISTTLYTATGVACGIACAISLIPGYGNSQMQTMAKICGGLGLVTSLADVGMAIASNDIAGGLMSAVSAAPAASGSLKMVTGKMGALKTAVTGSTKNTLTDAGKQAKSMACINTVIYLGTGIMKGMSLKKLNSNKAQGCANVESLATMSNSPVQSCLAAAGASPNQAYAMAGIFTTTPESFPRVSTDDVNRQEVVAGKSGDFMKAMKGDLDAAVAAGTIDMNDIAKRLDKGEDVSSIAASAGLPAQLTDPLKEFESKVKAGQTSAYLASLTGGGGYSAGSGAIANESSGGAGNGDLSFGGGGASPGEGAATLDIDRKPAAGERGLMSADGDVFHGSFGGSIFEIVTYRVKAQKENYAELDPEGRLNRLFNGFGEPGKKTARKPASNQDQSAR